MLVVGMSSGFWAHAAWGGKTQAAAAIVVPEGAEATDSSLDSPAGGGGETLRVITSLHYPPFSFRGENDVPRGFDLDLVHLVALKLGKTVTIEEVPFEELLSRLEQGRADLALDAITLTESRKAQVDFSDPYFHVPKCILSQEGFEIKKPEDLKGKTIAVQKGSTQTGLVKHLKDQGVVGKVLVMETLEQSVAAVKDGRADVAVMECVSAEQYVHLGNTLETQHLPLKHISQPISIAMTKKSPYLKKINRIIHELKTDKVLGGLAKRWFGAEHAGGR